MAKRTNRAASALAYVAALGLAFGASAAHWELSTANSETFASEALGDDAGATELTLQLDDPMTDANEGTHVNLALVAPDGVGGELRGDHNVDGKGCRLRQNGADQRL